MQYARPTGGTRTILFADIANSTLLTEHLGDADFRARSHKLDVGLRRIITETGGRPIDGKLLGDGILATFETAHEAIECALLCTPAANEVGLLLHVGIHAGDIIQEEDNVFGGAVNIAARISSETAPGEILVSDTVRSLSRTSTKARFENRGFFALKGVSDAVNLFRVTSLNDDEPEAAVWIEDSVPHAYTPGGLIEKASATRNVLEGERKQVTVLFAEIYDSNDRIDNINAELAQQILAPVLRRLTSVVRRRGGTLKENFSPKRITALFGAPLAHEDHAIRACYAALEMQAAIRDYMDGVRRFDDIELGVRVGINSGEVVVQTIRGDSDVDYSAVGPTTSLAERMEQSATPGSIWITDMTRRLAERFGKVDASKRDVSISGIAKPVQAFELIGFAPYSGLLQAAAAGEHTPFVGRQAELQSLHRIQDQAASGRGQILAIVGEPGVGKSRLVRELVRSQNTQGWLVLDGASASYDKATPYHPVLEILKKYIDIRDTDDVKRIREKVQDRINSLNPALQDTIDALQAILGIVEDSGAFKQAPPDQQRIAICNAIKRILLYESRKRPLMLVFDDLHWLDSETEVLLEGLLESVPTSRLLLIISYRPEYLHSWGSRTFYNQVRLDPLSPANANDLLQSLMGDHASLNPLKSLLIERTQGNPFFLEECVKTLEETHELDGEPGNYVLTKSLDEIQAPDQVQAVLEARIDRLSSMEKRLLRCAAVIGKNVPFELLRSIAKIEDDNLRKGLARLQATEFLYEVQRPPEEGDELEYTFKHVLTHEVAYNGLLERQRRALHATTGFIMEERFADGIDEALERIAYHFGRSAEDEKAVDYAILAADKMQRRWANDEAISYFEAALNRLKGMPDNESNNLRRIDAVLKQVEVNFALGMHTEQIEALEGICDLVNKANDPRRRAAWYYWMGFLHIGTGSKPEVAISYCQEASTIAGEGGLEEIRAFAECCLAQVYVVASEFQSAIVAGERCLVTFEAQGNTLWACRALWHLSSSANALGEWKRALMWCERSLEHARAVDDTRLKVVSLWRIGLTHIQMGDIEEGLRWCDEAFALSPTPFDAAWIRAVKGHGLIKIGEIEQGTTTLSEAVAWFEQSNLSWPRSFYTLALGEVYLRQGERTRAKEIFEEVLITCRKAGYTYIEACATRLLGESLIIEDPVTANCLLEQAALMLERAGAMNEFAKALVALADLRRHEGRQTEAQELLNRSLAIFDALGTLDQPLHVRTALEALQGART